MKKIIALNTKIRNFELRPGIRLLAMVVALIAITIGTLITLYLVVAGILQ